MLFCLILFLKGYLGEQVNLIDRIHILRFLYYISVGCFQIRNPEHHLKVQLIRLVIDNNDLSFSFFFCRFMIEKY